MVDLGGSLAVASMGLYATGVSTDLNGKDLHIFLDSQLTVVVTYLSTGGKVGDTIRASAVCEKSATFLLFTLEPH